MCTSVSKPVKDDRKSCTVDIIRFILSISELRLCSSTFSFMVLWFFFVFFKNCLRLPEDMYSVMKMTCRRKKEV